MKLPRYLLTNGDQGEAFGRILGGTVPKGEYKIRPY